MLVYPSVPRAVLCSANHVCSSRAALPHAHSSRFRALAAQRALMKESAVSDAAAELITSAEAPQLPWWMRMTRWRPTSKEEAVHAEMGILNLLRSKWQVEDVPVGPGPEQYMHTLTNNSSSGNEPVQGPAMVLMPGYGAGTGFFFRCGTRCLARLGAAAVWYQCCSLLQAATQTGCVRCNRHGWYSVFAAAAQSAYTVGSPGAHAAAVPSVCPSRCSSAVCFVVDLPGFQADP
eukprot:GHRQ01016705.1.p1 GENE.GHRQ01016705.1~~GHRQ01016705.1.p1  ORF type:complete len:233 (+),score=46.94 GHRQ01016705.1:110-808(+)